MTDERRDPAREPWQERFDDLKDAYALGALTQSERRELEGYLVAHPELDDLGSVAHLLALAPQEYDPPPELRRTLLEKIEGATDTSLGDDSPPRTGFWRLFGSGGLAPAAVAAAAVVAVVGLFVWNVSLRGENEEALYKKSPLYKK